MSIVFITNVMNHHQLPVADEMYSKLQNGYAFIATMPMPKELLDAGYPIYNRPYLINAYQSKSDYQHALEKCVTADVAIIGSAPYEYVAERIKNNKLTFWYSERWFKNIRSMIMNPYYLWRNHYRNQFKQVYMLAASAYTAQDVNSLGLYKNKVFKWGYFTKVPKLDIEDVLTRRKENRLKRHQDVSILWVARLIGWKHPELPIFLAKRLKDDGYKFCIDMFGSGEKESYCRSLAHRLGVEDVVHFQGNRPNDEILEEMRKHDIFLFTSDKNEGWGAVLNEAMSNACAVVASDKIGAVPFLIQDGKNGLIYKSENGESLYRKVKYLIDDIDFRTRISKSAYNTISSIWSPLSATNRFIQLSEALLQKQETPFLEGPCSKA